MGQEQYPAQQEKPRTPGERAGELVDFLVGDWRPSEQQILQWVRIAVAVGSVLLVVLLILYVIGFIFGIPLSNLLRILAIPITVGAAVPLLNWLQKKRELDIEHQRAQDKALQAYLDQMSQLLTDTGLRSKTHWLDDARVTARARSLAALRRLDGERKRNLLQFLYEAQLINKKNRQLNEEEKKKLGPNSPTEFDARIVGLSGADLRKANLRHIRLENAALDGAILEKANLRDGHLWGIDLGGAFLSGADLRDANLSEARLVNAHLQRKDKLNLNGASLNGADLSNANLSGANLKDATGWNEEQLKQTASLEGATMPDGQKYEDWLKSKGRGEDGEKERTSHNPPAC